MSVVAHAIPAPAGVTARVWIERIGLVLLAVALLVVPELLDSPTRVRQFAQFLCFATVAVGIDLVWGYGGMLAFGQGVFFGLGAYAMGMHLSLEQVPPGAVPQFMALYGGQTELPLLWRPFSSLWVTILLAVLVPVVIATALGWMVFRNRIRGPYFAILTQATALIFWLILIGQLPLTAGTNGLTNFATVFGRSRFDPATVRWLYVLAAASLLAALLAGRQLVRSRYGRLLVAVRDGEDRVRFLGYDPAVVKTIAFAVAAGMAGVAGALAAPIIGIVSPNQFAVVPSILMVVWVAVGGRGTLYGAVLGALLVNWGRVTFSESRPDDWLYLQGLLFIVVITFVPGGIIGLVRSFVRGLRRSRSDTRPPDDAPPPAAGSSEVGNGGDEVHAGAAAEEVAADASATAPSTARDQAAGA